ncbi:MAG TPA: sugar phosphate nucleotidyltransferase [Bryobacteraceae bacterium]|nr:sugar phosphate nucleotidyltransferase [Bryobacteraceae bacterium]
MRAMILAGGMGTRLRPLTFSIPKPLLPVGEKPIVQRIIEQLRDAGITDLVLATGYQAELIRAFCGDGSKFGVRVSYVDEQKPLGTAGPAGALRGQLAAGELLLVMNGDLVTDLDFRAFAECSRASGCELTVAYAKYTYRSPYGVLSIADGAVEAVTEKPETEYAISAGIYCLTSAAIDLIPRDTFFTMPDLMKKLLAAGKRINAYPIEGQWMGLESIEHFNEALQKLQPE